MSGDGVDLYNSSSGPTDPQVVALDFLADRT